MIFCRRLINRQPSALMLLLLARIVGCKVGTEERPVLPAIAAVVNKLATVVHPTAIERIQRDGSIPVKPQFNPFGMHRLNKARTPRLPVYQAQIAPLRHSIYISIVIRFKHHIKAVAKVHLLPVVIGDTSVLPHLARSDPGAIVLHTPGHIIGDIHIVTNMIELRQRQIGDEPPRLSAVATDIESAVIALNQVVGILRMNPESMVVRMHPRIRQDNRKRFPPVLTSAHERIQAVHPVFIFRVDVNFGIIEWTVADILRTNLGPLSAPVGTLIERILFGLDQRIDHFRLAACDGQAHAPQVPLRQPVLAATAHPIVSAIQRDIHTGARPTGVKRPGLAAILPHSCDQLIGISRIYDQFGTAHPLIDIQYLLPGFATITRTEDPPLGIRTPDGAQRSHVDDLRIIAMNDDAMNIARSLQPHALPRFATIETFVDTRTRVVRIARIALPGAHPDHIRILLVDRYSTDGLHWLLIEHRRPGDPPIHTFPYTAGSGASIDDIRITQVHIDGRDTAAHTCRPYIARLEGIKKRKLQRLRQQRSRQHKECAEEHQHPFFHTVRL